MKKTIKEWSDQQRLEALFFLAAIALLVVGLNGSTPLIIVGASILLLIFLRRYHQPQK
jgi:hypothetical protein